MGIRDRLYLATISSDAVELAKEYSLGIEIDEFCTAMNMDQENFLYWDKIVREKLSCADRTIFHAPFNEIHPCAIDPLVRDVAKKRLNQAYTLAKDYGINRMVVHSGHIPTVYFKNWFLERSTEFWIEFMADKPSNFSIMIENVLEDEPYTLAKLIETIDNKQVTACLDIGHAYFGSTIPADEWVNVLGPFLGHVHLHNNDKRSDRHWQLGKGDIDIEKTLNTLFLVEKDVTFTIESSRLRESLRWLMANGLF